MTVVAYTPKQAYRDPDALGAVYVSDTIEVNVRELFLASEDGVFVVDDPATQAVLDRYEPLKRTRVPGDAPEAGASPVAVGPIDDFSKPDLLKLPEADRITNAKNLKVEELRDKIKTMREEAAE